MQRIETATRVPDLHGPGKDGFTAGDPLTGTPATSMSPAMWNSLQEELCGLIEEWLGPLDPASYLQLRNAIDARIISALVGSGVSGKVNKAGDSMTGALSIVMAALQLSLQHSTNTATLQDHLRLFRGTGAGTRAALQTLGDAANGLSEIDINFLSAANALVKAFKFKNNGRLELGADPTLPLEAATKQFVESLLPAGATNPETLALAVAGKYVSPSNLAALIASTSQMGLGQLATAALARSKAGSRIISASNLADLAFESTEFTLTLGSTGVITHGLGVFPSNTRAFLRVKTAEYGFSVGEEIPFDSVNIGGNTTANGIQVTAINSTNLRYMIGGNSYLYVNSPGGTNYQNITLANHRGFLRAWA